MGFRTRFSSLSRNSDASGRAPSGHNEENAPDRDGGSLGSHVLKALVRPLPVYGDFAHEEGGEHEEHHHVDEDPYIFPYEQSTPPEGEAAANSEDNGRGGAGEAAETPPPEDLDPSDPPPPLEQPTPTPAPTNNGRETGTMPGIPQTTAPAPAPGDDNAEFGRAPDAEPETPPDDGTVTTYTSGGPASSSYNVTIDFVGTWTAELQQAFTDAADYLSTIILADLPDVVVDSVIVDDITITATLEGIDGVGGTLGSAGPRQIRNDGTYLPATGAMTFDSADADNQFNLGNWETIVLHEMMHALGFGTLWSLMGLTTGSVAGGDMRFTGANATDVYQSEFPTIAGSDPDANLGVPIETDGGAGTAGGHWDEILFDKEIMTGYVDQGGFISEMTIAALEDMGYDTVFDDAYDPTDLSAPIPADPLLDLLA